MLLQIVRRFERVGHRRGALGRLAEVLFVDDETAADRVIGFAVQQALTGEGADAHAVFVQRQVIAVEIHAAVLREIHLVMAVGQRQAAALFDVADKAGNAVDVHVVRQVAGRAHDDGDIGVVAFTGQRQRTVHVDHHAGGVLQLLVGDQIVDELFAGFHRANGVGTGWADANFENIENADHGLASFFRFQAVNTGNGGSAGGPARSGAGRT